VTPIANREEETAAIVRSDRRLASARRAYIAAAIISDASSERDTRQQRLVNGRAYRRASSRLTAGHNNRVSNFVSFRNRRVVCRRHARARACAPRLAPPRRRRAANAVFPPITFRYLSISGISLHRCTLYLIGGRARARFRAAIRESVVVSRLSASRGNVRTSSDFSSQSGSSIFFRFGGTSDCRRYF